MSWGIWVLGGIVALIVLEPIVNMLLVRTSTPGEPFWFCKFGLHPWLYAEKAAEIPDDFPMPSPLIMGLRAKIKQTYGEENLRRCQCCGRIQRLELDFAGCVSITDPPSNVWRDIK